MVGSTNSGKSMLLNAMIAKSQKYKDKSDKSKSKSKKKKGKELQ